MQVTVAPPPRIVVCCGFEIVTVKVRFPCGGFSFVWIEIVPSREPAGTVAVPVVAARSPAVAVTLAVVQVTVAGIGLAYEVRSGIESTAPPVTEPQPVG